jgi:hypothetical protein
MSIKRCKDCATVVRGIKKVKLAGYGRKPGWDVREYVKMVGFVLACCTAYMKGLNTVKPGAFLGERGSERAESRT